MSHRLLNYAAQLRARGLRLTPQREMILDAICEAGGHTTFEEIYNRLRARAPAINRATLYRTLDLFRELGLVLTADIGDHCTRYEIAGVTPHHHLVCQRCGQVIRLDHTLMADLFARLEEAHQFKIGVNHIVLYGLCQRCGSANPVDSRQSAVSGE